MSDIDKAVARFTRPVVEDHLIQAEKDARLLATEVVRLRNALDAVEALHWRNHLDNNGYCQHCSSLAQEYVTWPCQTRMALMPKEPEREGYCTCDDGTTYARDCGIAAHREKAQ